MPKFNSIKSICQYCKKSFLVQPNQVKSGEGKYCSNPCRHLGSRRSLSDRLWEKIDKSGGDDACWPYMIKRNTYGLILDHDAMNASKIIGAHVAVYRLTYGTIPQGMLVLHKCPNGNKNKRCCNPNHLYLGTNIDNTKDAMNDGVIRKGNSHNLAKITSDDAKKIRELYGIVSIKELSVRFNLSSSTLSDIIRGNIWKDAGGPIKNTSSRKRTHCINGHQLTEDNIILTQKGKARNCKICYIKRSRKK